MVEMLSALPNLLRIIWANTLGFVTIVLQSQPIEIHQHSQETMRIGGTAQQQIYK